MPIRTRMAISSDGRTYVGSEQDIAALELAHRRLLEARMPGRGRSAFVRLVRLPA